MFTNNDHRPTQAIVNLDAIRNNIRWIKDKMDNQQLLGATVKANAYGHGAVAVARAALEAGADYLLVATVDEGIELRENGISQAPILVLGLTQALGIAEILHYNLTITVSSTDFFQQAYDQLLKTQQTDLLDKKTLNFHLALDTGMGRIGLRSVEEVQDFKEKVAVFHWAHWQGVFTHFATAGGGPADYIDQQYGLWLELLQVVPQEVSFRHFANSGMAIWQNNHRPSDMVRWGISMYGINPKDQLDDNSTQSLEPALELISEIIYVKQVKKGSKISYGAKYEAQEEEWIATIPIGYADGWLRHYHNLPIIVAGHACPILGVINMDQLMIRLPHYYPVGTTVTLIGNDGQLTNHVAQMAHETNSISYEILTNIGQRVPRVYLNKSSGDES